MATASKNVEHFDTVAFRMFGCHACHHIFRWIDERLPTFCPECGKVCYQLVIKHFEDLKAKLYFKRKE